MPTRRISLLLALALQLSILVPGLRGEQVPPSVPASGAKSVTGLYQVEIHRDIVYRDVYPGEDGKKNKNRLDLYLPTGARDFPVLFFVHGGAWMHGDKNFRRIYSEVGSYWAQHGVGTVVTNYRLSPGVKHPEHIKDVAKAFAWTHQHIAKYGGRPDAVFVCGHSAGGHLIALLATDESYLKAEGLSLRDIRGAMPISGVFRIHDDALEAGISPASGSKSSLPRTMNARLSLLSSVFGSDPAARKQASPLTYVKPGLPPFLILYADRDLAMLPELAREFEQALRASKCAVSDFEIKGRTHMTILTRASNDSDPVVQAMHTFIDAHRSQTRTDKP
jgi:acetyl esterase/lipase